MKLLLSATFALLSCSVALAQGPPPGGFGGFDGRPGPPRDGGGMQRGPRPVSVTNLPLRTLSTYLGITDAQKGQIAQIREDMRGGMRPPMPGGQGGPRDDMREKMQAAERQASTKIKAILTPAQNTKLATLIKAAQGLAYDHVQPEGLVKLRLTSDQMARLSAVNEKTAHNALSSILTSAQKEVVKSYRQTAPPQRRGGGEGRDMPPPPDNI